MVEVSKWTLFGAIAASGWFGRTIVSILFILSVIGVAIFIKKVKDFRNISILNKTFLSAFIETNSLEIFSQKSKRYHGPLAVLFEEGYKLKNTNDITTCIHNFALKEKQRIEAHLLFLATTATISPFLGLLGTVWGILTAFMDIRTYGSAHINVVAPGIAESLVTTVVGLCVAIPAVVFYNYCTNKANKLNDEIDMFAKEIIDKLSDARTETQKEKQQ